MENNQPKEQERKLPNYRSGMAEYYNVSRQTLTAWFERAGLKFKRRRVFTPAEVDEIVKALGE